jgi:hypothetical protein
MALMNPAIDSFGRRSLRLHPLFLMMGPGLLLLAGIMFPVSTMARPIDFKKEIEPVLANYCYDCHGEGASKGNVAFDQFRTSAERLEDRDLWQNVLKNLRAGIMPPAKKPRPNAEEQKQLETWIKQEVFAIDPENPDPGRVTLRRLNRVEYQNTIRDLMGIEFRAYEEFPPDDTGYGFDNIGDVLNVSPLLLEKYMRAAETIVGQAVPIVNRIMAKQTSAGGEFKSADGRQNGAQISLYTPARVARSFQTSQSGDYRWRVEAAIHGAFDYDPGRARITLRLGDQVLIQEEHAWQDRKPVIHEFTEKLSPGEHRFELEIEPLVSEDEKKTAVDFRLSKVVLEGPMAPEHWVHPFNYKRFFSRDEAPSAPSDRRTYAAEVLRNFTARAFRGPVDEETVEKLAGMAEREYSRAGISFEAGVSRAMVAVLASPRFLFRTEEVIANSPDGGHPLIDEHALASRLSYFLWSTMPDDELIELARRGELRRNLHAQVERMLADNRSNELVENFAGQWLEIRDIEGISIDERVVLARDQGRSREMEEARTRFRELRDTLPEERTPEEQAEFERVLAQFRQQFRRPTVQLDGELRRAMRRETEMMLDYVLREDRSVLELIDSNYTFLNERLAGHYGVPDVSGREMRRVALPPDSPRGGILTHGSVLVVTSNPTRTSPVKRGVFILDHILGTPPPPPPEEVPQLEDAEKEFTDREPTLREALELHRNHALCKSCHDRMDPLGLALENFNALGMWRDTERGLPIDAAGKLVTGESFSEVRELKRILTTERRFDFYRSLTEKLLIYALGRGLEYYDVQVVDEIVERLENQEGRFSALLSGVIDSAPFQKRRGPNDLTPARGENAQLAPQETRKIANHYEP